MGQGVQMRVMAAFIYSFMMTVSVLATAVYTHNHYVSNYDCKLSHSQTHSLGIRLVLLVVLVQFYQISLTCQNYDNKLGVSMIVYNLM